MIIYDYMIIYVHIYILGILVIYIYENCILYIYIYHYMCLKPEDQFYWRLEHQGTERALNRKSMSLCQVHTMSQLIKPACCLES